MASVATAPNDSNDDRSGTENKDLEDGDNEQGNVDEDSDATVNIDLQKAVLKNKDLAKQVRTLKAQYNRAVKQKEENVRKHAQSNEIKKTASDGTRIRHKAEVSDLKTSWKHREKDLRDTSRAEISSRSMEIRLLKNEVNQLERDKTGESIVFEKLQASLVKEKAAHAQLKGVYIEACRKMDGVTEINKELSTSLKLFKKKRTDDQSVKFEHDEKMLAMQLKRDTIQYDREKDRREDKESSDKASLEAKNAHTILAHSLREKTKDDDLLCREIAKKKKDVQVSNNVGLIAAGLRQKQMHINNGQFNANVTLEAVSFFVIAILFLNSALTILPHSSQRYDTLMGNNALMHSSQQPPAAVHHYQVQERAVAPVYHRPTPSPQKRRQDTLCLLYTSDAADE